MTKKKRLTQAISVPDNSPVLKKSSWKQLDVDGFVKESDMLKIKYIAFCNKIDLILVISRTYAYASV